MAEKPLHFLFWLLQPLAGIAIGIGILFVAAGRWALKRESELRR